MTDERFAQANRTKDNMEALLHSKGWKELDAVFLEKEEILLTDLLDPGKEFSDIELREMRMALINLRVNRVTPEAMLLDAKERIQEFADLDKEEAGIETSTDGVEPPDGAAP